MASNTYQTSIVPTKPHVLKEERITVYVPTVTKNSPGIASFRSRDFLINDTEVSLAWPKQMEIEQLANPVANISEVKLLEDEFVNTGNDAVVTNPLTGVGYKSKTAEVKLNRQGRDATVRPDLIKVSSHDFVTETDENGEVLHKLRVNDVFVEPSLIQIDREDFKRESQIVKIRWPYAHDASGTSNTNGYGLVKIAPNSANYLKYTDGLLSVDDTALFTKTSGAKVRPTYLGTRDTGFTDIDQYIDDEGFAKRNEQNNLLLSITKQAVGLSNVANRSFNTWRYSEFGPEMQSHFTNEFGTKLDKTTWNNLFSDWAPATDEGRTPELRFDQLRRMHNAQQEQIDTLFEIKSFLGYFETVEDLTSRFEPEDDLVGCSAYVWSTNSYWSVRQVAVGYEWYDTGIAEKKFADYVETDPKKLRPNGEPSVGSSGRWIQSDHIHPVDTTRLTKSIYKGTSVDIKSQFGQLSETQPDFTFNFWNEDASGIYDGNIQVNIPYVRKAQTIHNWAGGHNSFTDSEESSHKVWIGSKESYTNEIDDLDNNSLIFIDDDEEGVPVSDDSATREELYNAGLLLDSQNQIDKIVTTTDAEVVELVDSLLTLMNDGQRYKLVKKVFSESQRGCLAKIDENGNLTSSLDPDKILQTNDDLTAVGANRLIATTGDRTNTVTVLSFGDADNKLLVTKGGGVGIIARGNRNGASFLYISDTGDVHPSGINMNNYLVSSPSGYSYPLMANQVLISGSNNIITTFNTGTENKLIVANGTGAFKQSTIPANRLLYTSSEGTPAAFAMSEADAGKVLAVDTNGNPTLSSLVHPTNLPISVETVAPTTPNTEGYKLVLLDSEPTEKFGGYIYCW